MKHLYRTHSTTKLVPKDFHAEDKSGPPPLIQAKAIFLQSGGKVNSEQLKRIIAAYVVEEMLPLLTVESPSFRDILTKIQMCTLAGPKDICVIRQMLTWSVNLKTVEHQEYVSTTADIWTSSN